MNGVAKWLKKLCEDQKICFGIIAISSALFYAIPVNILGLPLASDLSIHLGFFKELQLGVSEWDLLPGWSFDNGGYGNIGIRLYPPMASYSLIVLSALTGSLYDAVWLTYFLWMIIGGTGIYFLALEIGGTRVQPTFASVIYTMIPFPLFEFCNFFLVAEFIAGAIVPYCFLFALRVCRRSEAINILLLGLSLSALILTHIPTTILSGISLVTFVLLLLDRQDLIKVILRQCFAIILALLATAFYWIRLVREAGWVVHYDDRFFAGYFGFRQQLFPSLPNTYNLLTLVPPKLYIDLIIILTATMLLPFIVLLFWKRKRNANAGWRPLFAISSVGLFGLFMMSKASYPVWYLLTPLQRVQFPWRWLAVVSVLAPISFVLSVTYLKDWFPVHRSRIAFFVLALIVITVSFDIRQTVARPSRVDRPEFYKMADEAFLSAQVRTEHWRPKWAKQAALDVSDRVVADGRYVEVTGWDRYSRTFNVGAGEPGQIRVSTFYYPNWKASVNGQSVQVGMDENGAILVPIESRAASVELRFEEPLTLKVAGWISLFSSLAIVLGAGFCLIRMRRRSE